MCVNTHWAIIGSDNDLLFVWYQTIICQNQCWVIFNWNLRNIFYWNLITIQTFLYKNFNLKILPAKCLPFCLSLIELITLSILVSLSTHKSIRIVPTLYIYIYISGLILGLCPANENVSHWLRTNLKWARASCIYSSHIIHPTCDSLSRSRARSGGIRWAIFSNARA